MQQVYKRTTVPKSDSINLRCYMNSFLKRTLSTACDINLPKCTIKNKKLEITSANETSTSANWASARENEFTTSTYGTYKSANEATASVINEGSISANEPSANLNKTCFHKCKYVVQKCKYDFHKFNESTTIVNKAGFHNYKYGFHKCK